MKSTLGMGVPIKHMWQLKELLLILQRLATQLSVTDMMNARGTIGPEGTYGACIWTLEAAEVTESKSQMETI